MIYTASSLSLRSVTGWTVSATATSSGSMRSAGCWRREGTELGGPWSDHLEGAVWELRIRLRDVAARVAYWCTPDGTIVLLTVFRKTRQHDQRQIDRAVRAQKLCESDHHGPAAGIYERQV